MNGSASGVISKDSSSGNGGGATRAFEVGDQTMVCPIIVEDLNPPGQMLVKVTSVSITAKQTSQDIDPTFNRLQHPLI